MKPLAASSAVHLLVTSRKERGIEEYLSDVIDASVTLDAKTLRMTSGILPEDRTSAEKKTKVCHKPHRGGFDNRIQWHVSKVLASLISS
jgi:hypothetical protein